MNEETKSLPLGLKVGLFFVFIGVWIGLAFMLDRVMEGFRKGGWGMWPILAVGMVFLLITIDRIRYLFFIAPANRRNFIAEVQKQLMHGNVAGALSFCQASRLPIGNIVAAGLASLHRPDEEVQEAVDEAALLELPRIEQRTGYLAMIGNISTLLGLLGTIVGLIKSFAGVSLQNTGDPATMEKAKQYVHLVGACQGISDPKAIVACIEQNKAAILAAGISEAMNCTAFGLMVGIMALLAFSVLNGRTQHMLDDISDAVVYLMNLATGNRRAMKLM
jgi:biopolymer transport protein ExbB/TolQ